MPSQNSSMSSRSVMPAGARCTPGFTPPPLTAHHPPAPRERAQALAALAAGAALRGEPVGAALDDLAHPVKGFHVVLEGRPAEQPGFPPPKGGQGGRARRPA